MDKPPERSGGEIALGWAKVALNAAPYVGGSVAELLDLILRPSLERRQREWLEGLVTELNELRGSRGISLESLAENDSFIDVVIHASRAALASAHSGKVDALRNAVLNTACGVSIEDTNRHIYIRMVDEFAPAHLRLLRVFHEPERALGQRADHYRQLSLGGSLMQVVSDVMPDLAGDQSLLTQLTRDLESRGLISGGNLMTVMTAAGLLTSRTTARGKDFLAFVMPPE